MPIVVNDGGIAAKDFRSAMRYPVRAISATGGVNNNDEYIKADATGGAITLTLPLAASHPGREIEVKKKDASANAVTLSRSGADTINNAGATTFALATQDKYVKVKSDGVSAWDVVANN